MLSIALGIIAAFCGSIVYLRFFKLPKDESAEENITNQELPSQEKTPSLFVSYFCILLPLALMLSKVFFDSSFIAFISNPIIALLLSVLVSYYLLGLKLGFSSVEILQSSQQSFLQIAGILLIIGAGGAFNEILIEAHIGDALKSALSSFHLNPIFLAWLVAIILHASVGSATVAMISAAGIVSSLDSNISKEVLCLAIGSGAIGCTIVTDSLFWLVKENLGLSMKEMFKYFSGATFIASLAGLLLRLVLSHFT